MINWDHMRGDRYIFEKMHGSAHELVRTRRRDPIRFELVFDSGENPIQRAIGQEVDLRPGSAVEMPVQRAAQEILFVFRELLVALSRIVGASSARQQQPNRER
jgi:hypothetical protein